MSIDIEGQAFLTKAQESLATAVSELANQRYNSCANRCYYACFQGAIVALIQAGLAHLRERLQAHYPQAAFAVVQGDDPEGVYLVVTVDVEDTDAVLDVVIDDLFQL